MNYLSNKVPNLEFGSKTTVEPLITSDIRSNFFLVAILQCQ